MSVRDAEEGGRGGARKEVEEEVVEEAEELGALTSQVRQCYRCQ
jgi:hypothetical protein